MNQPTNNLFKVISCSEYFSLAPGKQQAVIESKTEG